LVQDAAYGTLLHGRRQELHARIAAVLEQDFADLIERADSGASRTVIPAHCGQHSGDCGQFLLSV
jgi:hypothetical protein